MAKMPTKAVPQHKQLAMGKKPTPAKPASGTKKSLKHGGKVKK